MGSWLNRKSIPRRTKFVTKRAPTHSRRWYIEELDRVTSLIVRMRDGACVTCGEARWEYLTCSHFYKRVWVNVRFHLINCNCQCFVCNDRHNFNVIPYTTWFVETYGTDAMHDLFVLRNQRQTPTDDELRALLESHRCMLRGMQ
jgi:hypothetical protein